MSFVDFLLCAPNEFRCFFVELCTLSGLCCLVLLHCWQVLLRFYYLLSFCYKLPFCCVLLMNFIASLLCIFDEFHCFLVMHHFLVTSFVSFLFYCALVMSFYHLLVVHSWWVSSLPYCVSPLCHVFSICICNYIFVN